MQLAGQGRHGHDGYAMVALLVALGVMGVMMSMAMPVWRQTAQREKEEELVFRGKQYAHAIGLFQRKYANASPPSVDALLEQRFLRRKYKDPMTADGEFQMLYQSTGTAVPAPGGGGTPQPGQQPQSQQSQQATPAGVVPGAGPRGGIIGVTSKSKNASIRLYNGRNHYNEWAFVYTAPAVQPGAATPGAGGIPTPGGSSGPRGGGGGRQGAGSPGGPGGPGTARPLGPTGTPANPPNGPPGGAGPVFRPRQ